MENYEKKDLLLEVGCEELPSRFIPGALKQLQENTASLMGDYRLNFDRTEAWGTPRRLVLLVKGLASRQPPLQQKVKGPPLERAYDATGAPTAALHGFARSQGLSPEALTVEKVKGSPYLFAVKELPERRRSCCCRKLTPPLRGISFSRPMSGRKEDRFPPALAMAFYGQQVRLPCGVDSGTALRAPLSFSWLFTVDSVAGYFNRLERAGHP